MRNKKHLKIVVVMLLCLAGILVYNHKIPSKKTILTNTLDNKKVVVSGNAVGVKLKLDGVMVLAISDVLDKDGYKQYPLRGSGIKLGDIITKFNNKRMDNVRDFVTSIRKSEGKDFMLTVKRKGRYFKTKLRAIKSYEDNEYHLGMWVRDSIAGIGTMTFYEPQTGHFGALGHGISDVDTKEIFNSKGEILKSSILAVKKGRVGYPGELKGIFVSGQGKLGDILKNSDEGIYGTLKKESMQSLGGKMYEIASKEVVKCGSASILTNVIDNENKEYDIEILKVYRNGKKGMNIKVLDERLIKTTGGIVQGMSGCPILQNGKIIGAVTHVFVSDPTKGYGIFIENMLDNINF